MKLILILLFFLPMTIWAQKDETFAKFIIEDGSVIKGSSVIKNFERQLEVYNLQTNSVKNSTTLRFEMNTEGASGVLRNLLLSGGRMRSGEITVTYISLDRRFVRYKINMENINVEECADSGGSTIVRLHSTRIGWTNYSYTKKGEQLVSSKNGWDEESGTPWINF